MGSPILPFTESGRLAGARLCEFGTGSSRLLHAHTDWITKYFVPKMKQCPNAWVDLVGSASMVGNAAANMALSGLRIAAVEQFIKSQYAGLKFNMRIPQGVSDASSFRTDRLDNSGYWRAVVVRWYGVPLPIDTPVYPSEVPPVPNTPEYQNDLIDQLGWLDIIGGVVSIADLILDIAAVAAVAVTSVVGLALSIISCIIGMPALWASVDKLAEFNGQIQGYDDAMQDMADQYSDSGLDRKAVKSWPAIVQPRAHISGNLPISVNERFWRQGQVKGAMAAYLDVLKMEAKPTVVNLKVKGQDKKFKMNGKLYLRFLSLAKGDDVGVFFVQQFNAALKKSGKTPFPTTG